MALKHTDRYENEVTDIAYEERFCQAVFVDYNSGNVETLDSCLMHRILCKGITVWMNPWVR